MRNEFGEGSTPVLYRQPPRRRVGSHEGLVHHGARQAHRQRAVARQPRRDRHVGDAVRRRARRPRAGDRARHEPAAQLRSRDRRRRVAQPGSDDEPDSVAGGRGRHRHRDERVPRQQPEGHPHRRRERRSHRLERDRLVARSRHAVRAVAGAVRRVSVSAEEQLADSVGVRCEDRQAALSASAARRAVGSVFVAGRRGRPRVHHRPRRHDARDSQRRRRSKCSRRTCWTTGSTRRRRSSTTRCTCAAIAISTASEPSESRRHRHRRGARRVDHLHAHRPARLSCAAVRARSVSALPHRRVADSRDLLGAAAAEHAAEDAGQPLRQEVQRAVRQLEGARSRRRSISGTTSRTSARRPGRSCAASSTR